ncbi:LytTR family DNA-binding domain-containing protein [Hellea balneolensis]|uniref:LytTR family DNA-binding domain-containing protein n=1 Tax=Hellea balneolensis TaxID=287478 RepID=UPI00068813B9|nr:LytTR family DNA-binding domain-containing protein [Hellea balneolensis]
MMATSAIAGVILSILGPYGTTAFSLPLRFIYWLGLCMAGGLGAAAFDTLMTRKNVPYKPWASALGQSIGATLMVSLILLGFTIATYGWPGWFHILTMPFFIWVISIIICGVGELSRQRKHIVPLENKRPDIFERLKPSLREADIYALSSEDHYVRIMTSKGDDLILMRLSDAIKEMSPVKGLQTHRSYWVAEAGVDKMKSQDGKLSILLKNSETVPVSRNKAKTVREAGWV